MNVRGNVKGKQIIYSVLVICVGNENLLISCSLLSTLAVLSYVGAGTRNSKIMEQWVP